MNNIIIPKGLFDNKNSSVLMKLNDIKNIESVTKILIDKYRLTEIKYFCGYGVSKIAFECRYDNHFINIMISEENNDFKISTFEYLTNKHMEILDNIRRRNVGGIIKYHLKSDNNDEGINDLITVLKENSVYITKNFHGYYEIECPMPFHKQFLHLLLQKQINAQQGVAPEPVTHQ